MTRHALLALARVESTGQASGHNRLTARRCIIVPRLGGSNHMGVVRR
jgi:hypothetical protein